MKKKMSVLVLAFVVLAGALTGCGKKVPEAAKTSVEEVLKALQAKDRKTVEALLVPGQVAKINFKSHLTVGQKSYKSLPAARILSMVYFSTIKSFKVLRSEMDEEHARFQVMLDYPDGAFSSFYVFMKKSGSDWKFDLKKSVDWAVTLNGSHAFSALKLKKK